MQGEAANDSAGQSVSDAGDVNGDGLADLIIGAPVAGPNGQTNAGASYVVFGRDDGFTASISLSSLDGANGFKIEGEAGPFQSGTSVSGAADVNGDGFDDLLIGAPYTNSSSGASYVVFGKATGFSPTFSLSSLNGANGFKMNGEAASDRSGRSVSAAGDVNGDGLADIVIGAPYAASNNLANSGASYVVFGKVAGFAPALDLSNLNGANGFKIQGEVNGARSGSSVSAAGDVNGDGFDDLLIGAPDADANGNADAGTSYVVFGSATVALSKNHRTAKFPDTDGDLVTVKVNKGALSLHDFTFGDDGSLATLDLSDGGFGGTDVKISAKNARRGTGDGLADVGRIDAHGIDLGKVNVSGRFEQLFAGDRSVRTAGVKSLTVGSLGKEPGFLGDAADYHSKIVGSLGTLTVKGDALVMDLEIAGGPAAGIGKISIGGSLDAAGITTGKGAFIRASGDIGAVDHRPRRDRRRGLQRDRLRRKARQGAAPPPRPMRWPSPGSV